MYTFIPRQWRDGAPSSIGIGAARTRMFGVRSLFGRDLPFPYRLRRCVAHFLTVLGRRSGDAGGDGATVSSTMIGLGSRMMLFITTVVVFIINNYFILHIIIIILLLYSSSISIDNIIIFYYYDLLFAQTTQ